MPSPLPPNSFYLVSYPRSGNTWLINCLTMLLDGVPGEAYTAYRLYTEHHGESGQGFNFWCEPRRRPDQPVCIKSHDDLATFRTRHPAGPVLYIARDARDSLLSYYFFQQAYPSLDVEEITTTRIKGKEVMLSRGGHDPVFHPEAFGEFLRTEAPVWSAHVASTRRAGEICYLTYENLLENFEPTLRKAADFLKVPLARTYAEVGAVYHTGFGAVFTGNNRDFFRRGRAGDWKNWYLPMHVKLIDELLGPQLLEFGFETDPDWAAKHLARIESVNP